jgi:hypothetical protein
VEEHEKPLGVMLGDPRLDGRADFLQQVQVRAAQVPQGLQGFIFEDYQVTQVSSEMLVGA